MLMIEYPWLQLTGLTLELQKTQHSIEYISL